MEMIKDIIKQFYSLLIAVSCVLFVVWVFFSSGSYEGNGVFEGGGGLFEPSLNTEEIKNEGVSVVEKEVSSYIPIVKYTGGAKTVGEIISFKEELQVRKEDGSWVSGSLEDDYNIYLIDIRNQNGNSALICMTEEQIAGMEQIPSVFVYEKDLDLLCCYTNGIYTVIIKLYAANGGMAIYEFSLPVEIG